MFLVLSIDARPGIYSRFTLRVLEVDNQPVSLSSSIVDSNSKLHQCIAVPLCNVYIVEADLRVQLKELISVDNFLI